jgi:hypothetical protein
MREMGQSSKGVARFHEALAKLHGHRGLQALRRSSLKFASESLYEAHLASVSWRNR